MSEQGYLRRRDAAAYLKDKYGIGSWQTLAKLALTGNGPIFRKFGRAVLYAPHDLDEWMQVHIGAPLQSTASKTDCSKKHRRSDPCRGPDLSRL